MEKFKKITIILVVILLGVLIRILLSPTNKTGDIAVHLEWSRGLYQNGLANSYFYSWPTSIPTQPPLMMLGFWMSQHIYQNRYILSELHNLTHFPPAAIIIWFDQNGELLLLKMWAIIADISSALFVFIIINKLTKNYKLSIAGLILIIFNPVTIYESAFWGQNDLVGAFFAYLSYLLLLVPSLGALSIPLFVVAVSFKPTVLILTPIFILIFLKTFNLKLFINQIIGLSMGLLLLFVSFNPFLKYQPTTINEMTDIVKNRISPSAKGTIRASNSAYNFYSLFFTLDRTPGNQPFLFFNLNILGIIFYLIIITITSIHIFRNKFDIETYLFYLFFISQGSFVFMTSMLERYFFPAFIASIILLVTNFKHLRVLFIIQNIIWLLNLVINRPNNALFTKTISLISVLNYLMIVIVFFCVAIKPYTNKLESRH